MPTAARLRGRRAFADLAHRGRTVRSGPLRVRYFAAPGLPAVGYAISKRTGNAVVRNRIRRRLRAAVTQATTRMTSGFYLIIPDASTEHAPFTDLELAVNNAITALQDGGR
ncbi:MAG TPA: ribonuclease P protein component [Acidimicrobiales bacterium]|nr:ribonuclease P protein component [Acidimicrobiales bacterium]